MKELIEINTELAKYAISLTRERDRANDLLQETNLRVLLNKDKYEPEDIKRIAPTVMRNIFINDYKKNIKREYVYEIPESKTEHTAIDYYNCKDLYNKLEKLPNRLGRPLKMYAEGYSYKEIADIISIPINTVKTRIRAARLELSSALLTFN